MSTIPSPRARIHFLDELRGLCVLLMVAHHALYTVGFLFNNDLCKAAFHFFEPVFSPVFASLFFIICGISCHLSHNNWLRGLKLLGVALGMSAVLYFVMYDAMIWFGVLHMLACSILICAALTPLTRRIPGWVGMLVCALLFLLFAHWPYMGASSGYFEGGYFGIPGVFEWYWPSAWQKLTYLNPLGIGALRSADYYPLLPWTFVVLFGMFLGKYTDRFPRFMYKRHAPPLSWMGRYAIVAYIAHQPVIYGVCWLISLLA